MIDKSREYWYGDRSSDIDEFLREYTEEYDLECKAVCCRNCGSEDLKMRIDANEAAIQVVCVACGTKKVLLDCGDIWQEAKPRLRKCVVCKTGISHNVRIGFARREDGNVRWVYIGSRCTSCGVLASYLDWNVDYGPTTDMENNI